MERILQPLTRRSETEKRRQLFQRLRGRHGMDLLNHDQTVRMHEGKEIHGNSRILVEQDQV